MNHVEKAKEILSRISKLDTLLPGDVIQIALIIVNELILESENTEDWEQVKIKIYELVPDKEILSVESLKLEKFVKKYSEKTRRQEIVVIRQYFIFWLVKNKGFAYEKAGAVFGMDHSTCIYAVKTIGSAMYVKCKKTMKYVDEARNILRANGYL